ncbi:DEAD/DEAH box helicase [Larkinella sp. C7]|uniref:DEAD/DEAH box helicase n=1 Tax=Larkinella sp. C7 TaxID=2576607 RepID=UPI001111252B|nr:DEAD/DEAH box helicase [Larkinella sp. C7]
MAFELLSEPIRRYVYEQRWESLRPIQNAAIGKILTTSHDYILASRTASGKTEAAFLPILSCVDFRQSGVQVLYISPLIALINDQFMRIEDLCKHLDVLVTKWHGEASKTLKDKLLKTPEGVLLITPESLEAMFVNRAYQAQALFANLKFIVIDEIHAFLGTDRGLHLQSLIARIKSLSPLPVRLIGLSATIGDYEQAKKFTGNAENTKVLLDKTPKEVMAEFRYYSVMTIDYPLAFITDLYQEVSDKKTLIFPNSRGKAEEIAVKLQQVSARRKGHKNYFSHHSSIDKELREYVETFAKKNQDHPFSIACTSTLELGIDIGSVDLVVQIDSTFSVASLIQRIGRSGRRAGMASRLLLFATDPWSLLQSLACWQLYTNGFIEPIQSRQQPFDILFHQILSKLKEASGIKQKQLLPWIKANYLFSDLPEDAIRSLIGWMVEGDFVEALHDEYIVGIAGEKLVNSREFYSVFRSDPTIKIIFQGKVLGEIPNSEQIAPDQNIYLAAKIWKIIDVDAVAAKAEVIPAQDGKKPLFFGAGGDIHARIRIEMLRIIIIGTQIKDTSIELQNQLQELRFEFKRFQINNFLTDRPIIVKEQTLEWYTFTGSRINRTIAFLFKTMDLAFRYEESQSLFLITNPYDDLAAILEEGKERLRNIDEYIQYYLAAEPAFFPSSKWGVYLNDQFKVGYVKEAYLDIPTTWLFLDQIVLVY